MSKDLSAEIGFSFEAVLDAVQESARGRWFLDELKKRSGQQDMAKMTDSINRIETRIEGMSGHFTAAEDLAKVRNAIAAARGEIQKLAPQAEGLSAEGRLFAHLADLARKALPQDGPQAGVEKALRLVDHLDTSLGGNVMPFPTANTKSADKYFQQDASLFEQKPVAIAPAVEKPEAAPSRPVAQKPAAEPVPMGAKLTITRVGQAQPVSTEVPSAEVAVVEPAPAAVETPKAELVAQVTKVPEAAIVEAAPTEASEPSKPRIVIIRRKPEDMPQVPEAIAAPAA